MMKCLSRGMIRDNRALANIGFEADDTQQSQIR